MAWLDLQGVLVMVAVGVSACAQSQAPPVRSAANAGPDQPETTTVLTNAEVSAPALPPAAPVTPEPALAPAAPVTPAPTGVVSSDPPTRWSDGEILAALGAAQVGRDSEAKTARVRSKSVRVDRFAEDVLQQEREFGHEESGLFRTATATPSDLEAQVEDARRAAAVAVNEATASRFDHEFIAAELRYERTLLRLIEDEMLPSARAPQLRQFLQTLRAKTARRLLAAAEIESTIP